MSIDRIGKGSGGSAIQPSGPRGVGRSEATGTEAFRVGGASSAAEAGPLEQLRAGKITQGEYLDRKVEEATAHLQGRLPPEQLEFVQRSLREQLASDPVLVDLVHAATGALPPPGELDGSSA